jgi:hypothetical protein
VASILQQQNLTSKGERVHEPLFYVSDDPAKFRSIGEGFLGSPICKVHQANSGFF